MSGKKYVVIFESPDTNYSLCVRICEGKEEAFGAAYLALTDVLDWETDSGYVAMPREMECREGYVLEFRYKENHELCCFASIYLYTPD